MKNHNFQCLRSTVQVNQPRKTIASKFQMPNYHHHLNYKKMQKKISDQSPYLQKEKENISTKKKSEYSYQTPNFSKKDYIHSSTYNLLAHNDKSEISIKDSSRQTPLKYSIRSKCSNRLKDQRKTSDICFKSTIVKSNTETDSFNPLLLSDNNCIKRVQKSFCDTEKTQDDKETRIVHVSRRTFPQRVSSSITPTFLKKIIEKNKKPRQFKIQDFLQIKIIGNGKYGKVKLVMDKETGFVCALKILNKSVIKQENIIDTLIQQFKIQFYLSHPNIVKAYGYFYDTQNVYLLLEYCPNGNLQKLIKTVQSFQQQELLMIISNIFQAVFYLHCEGILHRDIKPQNIVISFGLYKLCDFGWAAYASGENRSTFCGTPLYVSPQVLKGNGYNQKADIWGLGILCYQLIYGVVPFKMNSPKDMAKIMKDKILFPQPETGISSQFINMIKQMLNRDYQERCSINELMSYPLISQFINGQKKQFSL